MTRDSLDLREFILPRSRSGQIHSSGPPRPRRGEKFLSGPVPIDWLAAAAALPGRALHVGIALWFWAGMRKIDTVPLSLTGMLAFGVSRTSAARALRCLEEAGLVTVQRRRGRKPLVIIHHKGSSKDSTAQ